MSDLWGASLPPIVEQLPEPPQEKHVNPCVDVYGPGPEGKQCRTCVHLHGFQQAATWYKCDLRKWRTKGGKYPGTPYPGGDHRVRWPACSRYEEEAKDES